MLKWFATCLITLNLFEMWCEIIWFNFFNKQFLVFSQIFDFKSHLMSFSNTASNSK